MDETKIVVRPACLSDKNFILSTWLKGQLFGSPYFSLVPHDIYYKAYTDEIARILAIPGVKVNVACGEEAPDWIVGFCVFKGDALYWVHVKTDYRNKGIAKLMLRDAETIKTVKALTKIGRAIADKKRLAFNPF